MKHLLLFLSLTFMLSFTPPQYGHNFFGIDMDADWYTLTNHSWITYANQEKLGDGNYVVTDFEYSKSKVKKEFLDLGFNELLLCFPVGKQSELKTLSPELFIGRISYDNPIYYKSRSENDISKLLALFKREFGDPDLDLEKEDVTLYKWESPKRTLILTCRLDELNTAVYYMKNVQ